MVRDRNKAEKHHANIRSCRKIFRVDREPTTHQQEMNDDNNDVNQHGFPCPWKNQNIRSPGAAL